VTRDDEGGVEEDEGKQEPRDERERSLTDEYATQSKST
jgi:hypothetical protein